MVVLVAGEALVDLVQADCSGTPGFVPRPGGSPLNVAVGLSRLGVPVGFLGKISRDTFGRMLKTYLKENGVELRYLVEGEEPSALSFVRLGGEGIPKFEFYGTHTADSALAPDLLPAQLPGEVQAIHLGSIAMVRKPSGSTLTALMEREHGKRTISFDPNIRPSVIVDRHLYISKLKQWLSLSDIVKVSQTDLDYLYPHKPYGLVAKQWLKLGPKLVVVTRGPKGAVGFSKCAQVEVSGIQVQVADTVGAGDAFTAGLLAWLFYNNRMNREYLVHLSQEEFRNALSYATCVAALTCTRVGADPPYRSEVESFSCSL